MSDYQFKAAYILDITEKSGKMRETLEQWKIPIEEEHENEYFELGAPWNYVKGKDENGNPKVVLQLVVSEKDGGDITEYGFAFRPELIATIMLKLHNEYDASLIDYMFNAGYGRFYPVAYTWYNGSDEPIVL